ncbi:MAG: hypothetical protein AB8G22_06085 [Saprospiraceae bacterium]
MKTNFINGILFILVFATLSCNGLIKKEELVILNLIPKGYEGELTSIIEQNKEVENEATLDTLRIYYNQFGEGFISENYFKNRKVSHEYFYWIDENEKLIDSVSIINIKSSGQYKTEFLVTKRINSTFELEKRLKSLNFNEMKSFNPLLQGNELSIEMKRSRTFFERTGNIIKYK